MKYSWHMLRVQNAWFETKTKKRQVKRKKKLREKKYRWKTGAYSWEKKIFSLFFQILVFPLLFFCTSRWWNPRSYTFVRQKKPNYVRYSRSERESGKNCENKTNERWWRKIMKDIILWDISIGNGYCSRHHHRAATAATANTVIASEQHQNSLAFFPSYSFHVCL